MTSKLTLSIALILCSAFFSCKPGPKAQKEEDNQPASPKIVNIVNFIRQCEPRIDWITGDVLYETVVSQIEIMKFYHLKGTFLLQYDALIDARYQELLKALPADQFEIGAWWEIPQPLVEQSGYVWRGRYPWDWNADVGFATGYTPEEREKLVDTYMVRFKSIFGYYPKSAGSWFIDAHTLNYMYTKYGITASCNCKDQIGTDGYTMWGGYWNQAYYPSKKNAYMPAQNAENQIPVPIFRMLGSDPIHQYDKGLGGSVQGVVSLEPVYKGGGGNEEWCKWYYNAFVDGPAMAYGYTQTGQENSFTWKKMEAGFKIQLPMIAKLLEEKKIEVKTLGESGDWFRQNYPVTPPTSVTVLNDHSNQDLKTVWFNSRFYRANLLWDKGTLRFRDIHVFDERVESDYLTQKGTSTECNYYTLPVVDGFQWSSAGTIAGMRFKCTVNDSIVDIIGADPVVNDHKKGILTITWPTTRPEGTLTMAFDESGLKISSTGRALKNWFLELKSAPENEIPITSIENNTLNYKYKGHAYTVKTVSGTIQKVSPSAISFLPVRSEISFDLSR